MRARGLWRLANSCESSALSGFNLEVERRFWTWSIEDMTWQVAGRLWRDGTFNDFVYSRILGKLKRLRYDSIWKGVGLRSAVNLMRTKKERWVFVIKAFGGQEGCRGEWSSTRGAIGSRGRNVSSKGSVYERITPGIGVRITLVRDGGWESQKWKTLIQNIKQRIWE